MAAPFSPTPNLADPATFVDGPPHAFFARLRREEPVWWHERCDAPGFYVVTRYDDVVDVLGDQTGFVNRHGVTIEPGEPAGLPLGEPERGQSALSYTDPPHHRLVRKVLAPHFTPARVRRLEPLVRTHAERLVGDFVAAGGGDFVSDVARPYPLRVLSAVLGLTPAADAALVRFVDQTAGASPEVRAAETSAFITAAGELADERRANPGDDLISAMVSGDDTTSLAASRLGGILVQLALAGQETTRAASATGVRLFADLPEVRCLLLDDPALVGGAVEELLRYRSPVHYTRRTVPLDAEAQPTVAGRPIEPGSIVYLSLASANRDEGVFADGDRFDPTRSFDRPHLGLGLGAHYCLGASLARLELRVLFETVLDAMPSYELAGEPVATRSALFDALGSLPVRAA
ncbi:MAG: cytochrome P450 [Acidimicrobiales bacterium]|nr:cytochrome P450 [Acidimicrobiales bacterium]